MMAPIRRIFTHGLIVLAGLIFLLPPAYAQEGELVTLFGGQSLKGWKAQSANQTNDWFIAGSVSLDKSDPKKFAIEDGEGIMVNGAKGNTTNIYTEYEHGDCQLHIEFIIPKGSNSGVYLQGLYEIQVYDSYGKKDNELQTLDCGAIYARWDNAKNASYEGEIPRVNASKAPGEWQSFDAFFRAPRFDKDGKKTENARFITVKHNGIAVHENFETTGGTRSHMNRKESPKGPLMLQGDHGPVAYRNIQIIPLNLK